VDCDTLGASPGVDWRPQHGRSDPIAGGYAELASSFADVINVSRTGVLIRTAHQHQPGDQWPLILDLSKTPIRVRARVVGCDPMPVRRGVRPMYSLGMTFVDLSEDTRSLHLQQLRSPFFGHPDRRDPFCAVESCATTNRYNLLSRSTREELS
jgi:hypothetical protein